MRPGVTPALLFAVTAVAACARDRGPPPALPPQVEVAAGGAVPAEWFWEPVAPLGLRGSPRGVDLPVSDAALLRLGGAAKVWDDLGDEARDRLRRDGLVVVGSDAPPAPGHDIVATQMGAFYMDLRERRVPYLVSLDALFFAVHVSLERALAEVEDAELAGALDAFLDKTAARIDDELPKAGAEIADGLRLARGVVAVALALASGRAPAAPASAAVAQELRAVEAHTGPATSPLLGVTIDYARFASPSGAARPGAYRALAWLSAAPFELLGKSEAPGAQADVASARRQTRAALLLARLVHREGDPEVRAAYTHLARWLAFVWGAPDDPSIAEIAELASRAGMNPSNPADVADVVKVDRVRRRAAALRAPLLYDGSGPPGRAGASVRAFGGHAPPDAVALSRLVGVSIGAPTGEAPPNARDGMRALPSTLDVMAWLGATEARAALHDTGADAFAGYDAALAAESGARPKEDSAAWHASVNGSLLDAIRAWIDGSMKRTIAPPTPVTERAAMESALAAWTIVRHDGDALTRPRPSVKSRATRELRVPGAAVPAFVEARPDVIARLVGTVRQISRGLTEVGPMGEASPARTLLAEVDDLLRGALRVAIKEANDEPLDDADVADLAAMPARLASLDGESAEEGGAMVPMVATVHVDLRGGRALTSATGHVEPALVVVREPRTGRVVLAAAGHVAHHELVEPIAQRTTDAALRARLRASPAPPRASYVTTFRQVR